MIGVKGTGLVRLRRAAPPPPRRRLVLLGLVLVLHNLLLPRHEQRNNEHQQRPARGQRLVQRPVQSHLRELLRLQQQPAPALALGRALRGLPSLLLGRLPCFLLFLRVVRRGRLLGLDL